MNTEHKSWPPDFDEAQRERVLKHVMWFYADRDVATALQDDLVTFPEAPERSSVALGNVAAKCAGTPVALWTTIIDLHLNELERLRLNQLSPSENVADYDDIADALTVQIWPEHLVSGIQNPIGRVDLDETRTLLTLDQSTESRPVSRAEASHWGRSDEELIETGIANLERSLTPVEREMDFGLSSTVRILMADPPMDCYLAGCALWLERVSDTVGTHGALVSVTNRDMLIAYPIDSVDVTQAITGMVPLVKKAVAERPHPISDNVYWRRPDGSFVLLQTTVVDNQVQVELPDDFAGLLSYLDGE